LLTAPSSSDLQPLSLHDALPILERVAGRVAGEDPSGAVAAVRGRGETDDGQSSVGRPESGNGVRPVDAVVEGAAFDAGDVFAPRSEEHTSELQSLRHLVCRLLLE